MTSQHHGTPEQHAETTARRRRLRGFQNHMIAFFGVMVFLVPLNAWFAPERPIFLIFMVLWGAPLAVHAAFAMGLIGKERRRPAQGRHHDHSHHNHPHHRPAPHPVGRNRDHD